MGTQLVICVHRRHLWILLLRILGFMATSRGNSVASNTSHESSVPGARTFGPQQCDQGKPLPRLGVGAIRRRPIHGPVSKSLWELAALLEVLRRDFGAGP